MNEQPMQGGDGELARCHICEREFPRQDELSRHLLEVHQEEVLGE
jgi:hypothetical protein